MTLSKEIEWSKIYGEGTIVCTCDNDCGTAETFDFTDNFPNYKGAQEELKNKGWLSCKINGHWYDFCCEKCRNGYFKKI